MPSRPSRVWATSCTSTRVTIRAAPATRLAARVARNGPLATPVRSMRRVRARLSQSRNSRNAIPPAPAVAGPQAGRTDFAGSGLYRPTTTSPSEIASNRPPTTSTLRAGVSPPPRPARQGEVDGQHGDEGQRDVHPEDPAPAHREGEVRPVERSQHAAEFLGRADGAENHGSAALVPQIPDQGHGDGQQGTTGEALQRAAGDQAGQIGRDRGQGRSGQEPGQAELDDDAPAQPIGEPTEQGHAGHVAEQVAGDDGGGPLQVVQRNGQFGGDADQDRDDHVRIEGGQQHRDRAHADGDPAPAGTPFGRWRLGRGPVGGWPGRLRGH